VTGPEQHAATVRLGLTDFPDLRCNRALDELVALASEAARLAGRADELAGQRNRVGELAVDASLQAHKDLMRAEAAEARADELSSDAIAESAVWLDAVGEAFPNFDFSGCYDHDDLRRHLIGQVNTLRERADELQRERDEFERRYLKRLDHFEQARREADQLRAALRPFATFPEITKAQRGRGYVTCRVPPEWIDAARDALAGVQADNKDSA